MSGVREEGGGSRGEGEGQRRGDDYPFPSASWSHGDPPEQNDIHYLGTMSFTGVNLSIVMPICCQCFCSSVRLRGQDYRHLCPER